MNSQLSRQLVWLLMPFVSDFYNPTVRSLRLSLTMY